MEKRRRIEPITREIQLPEEIIQHIQSFLSAKHAARTAIVSKSWHTAWLTRPNLEFSDFDIPDPHAFVRFAKKTLERYDGSNRKIQSFRLSIDDSVSGNICVAKELIGKAMKLGVADLDVKFTVKSGELVLPVLPREVLESETLVRLSLCNCRIVRKDCEVSCSRLEYLSLSRVHIEGSIFWDIVSMCPLIEELVVSDCDLGEDKPEFGAFDFPRIRKFKYSGSDVPSFSFKTNPRESEITIMLNSHLLQTWWFQELREFLVKLSDSRVSLYLSMSISSSEYELEGVVCLDAKPPIVLEKLTLLVNVPNPLYPVLSYGIFMCFRPRFMDLYFLPSWYTKRAANNDFTELICKMLIEESGGIPANNDFSELICKMIEESGGIQKLYADIEEVNVNFFAVEECLPLPCKTLVDASAYSGRFTVKVCLQLRWAAA